MQAEVIETWTDEFGAKVARVKQNGAAVARVVKVAANVRKGDVVVMRGGTGAKKQCAAVREMETKQS